MRLHNDKETDKTVRTQGLLQGNQGSGNGELSSVVA